ncbi:hypothetical protein MDAP_002803 [Mitosporidium daphniae]
MGTFDQKIEMEAFDEKIEMENSIVLTYQAILLRQKLENTHLIDIALDLKQLPTQTTLLESLKKIRRLNMSRETFQKEISSKIAEIEKAYSLINEDPVDLREEDEALFLLEETIKNRKMELEKLTEKQNLTDQKIQGLAACCDTAAISEVQKLTIKMEQERHKQEILCEIEKYEEKWLAENQILYKIIKLREDRIKTIIDNDCSFSTDLELSQLNYLKTMLYEDMKDDEQLVKKLYTEVQEIEDECEKDLLEKINLFKIKENEEFCLLLSHKGNIQRELEELESQHKATMQKKEEKQAEYQRNHDEKILLQNQIESARNIKSSVLASYDAKILKCDRELRLLVAEARKFLNDLVIEETKFQIGLLELKKDRQKVMWELAGAGKNIKAGLKKIASNADFLPGLLEFRMNQNRNLKNEIVLINDLRIFFK